MTYDLKTINNLAKEHFDRVHAKKPFVPGVSPVPVSGKVFDETDIAEIIKSALDFWLTTGHFNDEFEAKLKAFIGARFLLTVNSGSSANLVAFAALTSPLLKERALKAGDEVISVAAGFPTTVNPILQHGCIPVFIDVEFPTYNIKVEEIEKAITPKTKAIMIAHTLGNPFNLEEIVRIAKKYNLWLIEDCCDALGSTYNGQKVGTFGDIGTLSFYPAHHMTMGEGGAVFTNNSVLKRAMESIRDWGRDCYCAPGCDNTCGKRYDQQHGTLPFGYDHKYVYSHIGYNLKITDMQAACGLAQMNHLEGFIEARKKNFKFLSEGLKELENVFILPQATKGAEPAWFGFPITIKEGVKFTRRDLLTYLDEKKIGTRTLFAGNITRQPYMQGRNYRIHGELANTEIVMTNTFWVGVYPGLTKEMIDYIINTIKQFLQR
jgi:CDP-6-deoxy-D-xylo-4-hexulose-3-dehydrase